MSYSEDLYSSSCQSIDDIVDWCHKFVPYKYKARPWSHPELQHGVSLLASNEALNCYMSAYGDMHVSKCRAAMMNFPFNQLTGSIEIVDWGCGQGIGSASVIDALMQRDLLQWLRKVTLVEPSASALERARCNIAKLTNNNVEINTINKFLPANDETNGNVISEIGYRYSNIIHVFSNILDVRNIDLASLARLVAASHGTHFVLCVGPKNSASYRIEQFCSIFGDQNYFSNIDSVRYGRTKRTGHPYTCVTKCFTYNGSTLDFSRLSQYLDSDVEAYTDYDLQLQIENKVLTRQKARVAYRLQEILAVDDVMYIDPVVNETTVDFIIVRPNKGILLVNVFEKDLQQCSLSENQKMITVPVGIDESADLQSPVDLISLCQTSIKDGIEELLLSTIENVRNFGLIKKVVVFTENDISQVKNFFGDNVINYTYLFGKEFVFEKNVSHSLYDQIHFNSNSKYFDEVVKRKLAAIISPSWHSYQEGRIGVEPIGPQRELSKSRITRQKISGVAGSGKTHVLAIRAINAMKRTGGDVLILTFNITLANYLRHRLSEIREDFSWEKIDIYPYHQFFRIRASECELQVSFGSYDDTSYFASTPQHKRYSAIFVDEVQDYTTQWLRMAEQFLEPDGEFVVFGDPKQNVYHRPLDTNGDIRLGVIGGVWNRELNTSRRFTKPRLATLATSFQTSFFPQNQVQNIVTDSNIDSTIDFKVLTYLDLRMGVTVDQLTSNIITIIREDQNDSKDFVVLGSSTKLLRQVDYEYRMTTGFDTEITFVAKEPLDRLKAIHNVTDDQPASWKFQRDFEAIERVRKQLFTTDKRCLKISTIHSFKGWESPCVILILENDNLSTTNSYEPMAPETIYTAITRARENLYIINIGNNTYHNFFYTQSL